MVNYMPLDCCVLDWSLIAQPTGKCERTFINFKYVHLNYHKENYSYTTCTQLDCRYEYYLFFQSI